MCFWIKNSLELDTNNSLIIIWLMVSAGNRIERSSYAMLNPERWVRPRSEGCSPESSSAVQVPGPPRRTEQRWAHLQQGSGRD